MNFLSVIYNLSIFYIVIINIKFIILKHHFYLFSKLNANNVTLQLGSTSEIVPKMKIFCTTHFSLLIMEIQNSCRRFSAPFSPLFLLKTFLAEKWTTNIKPQNRVIENNAKKLRNTEMLIWRLVHFLLVQSMTNSCVCQ